MNNSRYKVLLALLAILLLTNGVLLYFYLNKKGPEKRSTRHDRSNYMRDFLKDSVGFNDQQLATFDQIREKHSENVKSLFEEMRNAKLTFYKQVNHEPGPDSLNQASAAAIAEKQKALDLAFFNHFREVRTICSPDQVPRYDSMVQQIIRRMVSPPRRGDSKQKKEEKK